MLVSPTLVFSSSPALSIFDTHLHARDQNQQDIFKQHGMKSLQSRLAHCTATCVMHFHHPLICALCAISKLGVMSTSAQFSKVPPTGSVTPYVSPCGQCFLVPLHGDLHWRKELLQLLQFQCQTKCTVYMFPIRVAEGPLQAGCTLSKQVFQCARYPACHSLFATYNACLLKVNTTCHLFPLSKALLIPCL